ncbi:hypothetical protein VPH35_117124 [Triticum aestivum]
MRALRPCRPTIQRQKARDPCPSRNLLEQSQRATPSTSRRPRRAPRPDLPVRPSDPREPTARIRHAPPPEPPRTYKYPPRERPPRARQVASNRIVSLRPAPFRVSTSLVRRIQIQLRFGFGLGRFGKEKYWQRDETTGGARKGEQERRKRRREDKRKEDKGEATRTRGGHRARSPDPAQVQLAAALTKGEGRIAPESQPRVPRASDPASSRSVPPRWRLVT